MSYNYSGPSLLNTAFHNVPHVSYSPWGTFTPTPDSVTDEYATWVQSVGFVPSILFTIMIFTAIGTWIAICCRCRCCNETRRCCCPPQPCGDTTCCCRLITLKSRSTDEPVFVNILVFSVVGAALLISMVGVMGSAATEAKQTRDQVIELNEYRDSVVDSVEVIRDLSIYNDDSLTALVNSTETINITTPLRQRLAVAQEQSAQAVVSATAAYDSADTSLDAKKNADDADYYINWTTITIGVFVGVSLGLVVGMILSSYCCETPDTSAQNAFESIYGVVYLIVAIVTAGMFGVLIGIGDGCQDPNAYLNAAVGDSNDFMRYYINCAPNSTNPSSDDLRSAYRATAASRDVVYDLYVETNTTYSNVSDAALDLVQSQTFMMVAINVTSVRADCSRPHAMLVDIQTNTCHDVYDRFAIGFLFAVLGFSFLLVVSCILPRSLASSFRSSKSREQKPLLPPT